MCYWSAFYPADVVKSRMQTSGGQFIPLFKAIYAEEGFRALYKVGGAGATPPGLRGRGCRLTVVVAPGRQGWGITVSRAVPSNAVLFLVYELISKAIRDL